MKLNWNSFMPPENQASGAAPGARNPPLQHPPTIPCRYCLTEVPHGALICLACKARIKYGPTYRTFLAAIFSTIVITWALSSASLLPSRPAADLVAIALFAVVYLLGRHTDRDRITFRRPWLG
jgi:hypothetical protein